MDSQAHQLTADQAGQASEKNTNPPAIGPTGKPALDEMNRDAAENPPTTQHVRRWLLGRQQSTTPTVLPQGVCRTVYYRDKNGGYRHFTPGLPPKKVFKDGPTWGPSSNGATLTSKPDESDEEEIGIPDALL